MDRDNLLEELTEDKIKMLMEELGSCDFKEEDNYIIFQSICHCSTSMKLYYYKNSKSFFCYSGCGCAYSVYDIISQVLGLDFSDSFKYLANFMGVNIQQKNRKVGFLKKGEGNKDLRFLKINKNKIYSIKPKQQTYDDGVLRTFDKAITADWVEEGISFKTVEKFELGFYINQNCMVIPTRNIQGELIGIRKRNYFIDELEMGRKYTPITIQNTLYRFPTAYNLYGIWQNKDNIVKSKKTILFESEKSVLKYDSMYKKNIALSIFGMNISKIQRDLILSLGVDEITIALDKQYIQEDIYNNNSVKNYLEFSNYLKKINKIIKMFEPYCNTTVIMDFNNLISYKQSPIDAGKVVFETLYKNKLILSSEELQEEIDNR